MNNIKAIVNAKIIVNGDIFDNYSLVFDNKIVNIGDNLNLDNIEIIDAMGMYVSAGFIDIHIHGAGGSDVMDGTKEALTTIANTILQTGTTSFLATTMTMTSQVIDKSLQNIKNNAKDIDAANIIGIHLEGPFINPSKHGAQNKEYIQKPNFELIKEYMDEVKMITIAPEVDGAKEFIEFMSAKYPEIILSIGHSDASYDETKQSFSWGVSHATHLFNAMNPYHHREPSIVGAVFDSDITCDIIADLIHTHPSTLELTQRVKKDKLILITDSMRAGCMKCGSYTLGGQSVEVKDGKATLKD